MWSLSEHKADLVHFKIGFIIKHGINFKISISVINSDYVMQLIFRMMCLSEGRSSSSTFLQCLCNEP